jgi:hypothetical protein
MRKKIIVFSISLVVFWLFFDVLVHKVMMGPQPYVVYDEDNNKMYVSDKKTA